LLSFKGLNLLLLDVLRLEFILNSSQALVDLNCSLGLLLNILLFRLRIFIWVLDAQLSNKDLHIKVIADFLTIEEQLLHFQTTLTELFI